MNQRELQRLFPEGVLVEVAKGADENEDLLPADERALMGAMVPVRRREFTAGRIAARRALAHLGLPAVPLLRRDTDRDIAWPAGTIGSISHTRGLCAAACARVTTSVQSLGLDVEQAGPLGDDIVESICRPDELEVVRALPPPAPSDWPRLLFAMKEAAFKAWYPLTRRMLDFHEMRIVLEVSSRRFQAEVLREPVPGVQISGQYGWDEAYVAAGAVLTRS